MKLGTTLGILGIVFITLKLTNTITWSWWWILAPFWINGLIILIILGIILTTIIAKK